MIGPGRVHHQSTCKPWVIADDTIVFDVNCSVGPGYILDCILLEALCAYNHIQEVDEKVQGIVKEAEQARKWVDENSKQFIFR